MGVPRLDSGKIAADLQMVASSSNDCGKQKVCYSTGVNTKCNATQKSWQLPNLNICLISQISAQLSAQNSTHKAYIRSYILVGKLHRQ